MRRVWQIGLMLAAVFAQASALSLVGQNRVTPNFLLVYLVVASLFWDYSSLVWLALGGGFILDLYSGNDFGINMAFYVLLVIIIKIILSLGESPARNTYALIVIGFGTVFYSIVMSLGLIGTPNQSLDLYSLKFLGIEVLYNVVLAFVAFGVIYTITGRNKTSHTYKLGKLK